MDRLTFKYHEHRIYIYTNFLFFLFQSICEYGREAIESWGRRRRSISSTNTNNNRSAEENDDMTLSQEILVLDFNEEKNEFLREEPPFSDFGPGNLT